jgi:hypothetical protein
VFKRKPVTVFSSRQTQPAEVYCLGSATVHDCRFAFEASRVLSEIDVRRMAREHAHSNPGHVVHVNVQDVTSYSAGE